MSWITDSRTSYTYDEMFKIINGISKGLSSYAPQTVIAVEMDCSCLSVMKFIAVMMSGLIALPIESSLPNDRKEKMKQLSRAIEIDNTVLYTGSQSVDILAKLKQNPDHIAYIIFTTGTTGEPKGIKIYRYSLVHYIESILKVYSPTEQDTTVITTSLGYDLSYTGLFLALVSHSGIRILSYEEARNPVAICDICNQVKATFLKTTSSLMKQVLKSDMISSLQTVFLGGEMLDKECAKILVNNGVRVVNHYGPCETTIGVCLNDLSQCEEDEWDYLGYPIGQIKIVIVDDDLVAVPVGCKGRLLIQGPCLGAGYINQGNGFVVYHGRKAFLTEDYGWQTTNGKFVIEGRTNSFVKIRGYRVSIQEVEKTISKSGLFKECKVEYENRHAGILVLYYINDNTVDFKEIVHRLKQYLPAYMIPQQAYRVSQFLVNSNGKRVVDAEKIIRSTKKLTTREKEVYDLWISIGGSEDIGPDDSLFDYNIDSLRLIEFVYLLEEKFPCKHFSIEIVRHYDSLAKLCMFATPHAIKEETYNDQIIQRYISPLDFFCQLDKFRTERVCSLRKTQKFYRTTGILSGVVLVSIRQYDISAQRVLDAVRQWMQDESVLRSTCIGESIKIKRLENCAISCENAEALTKEHIVYLWTQFQKQNSHPFYPCVFTNDHTTILLMFFLHEFCKLGKLSVIDDYVYRRRPLRNNNLCEKTANPEAADISREYLQQCLEFNKRNLNVRREEKYVSEYINIPYSKICGTGYDLNLLIVWLTGQSIASVTGENNVPVRIWRQGESHTILDDSDFDCYVVKRAEINKQSLESFILGTPIHIANLLELDMQIPMDSIYINIVSPINEEHEVYSWIKELKVSSIHGICMYGILTNDGLNICYSSNYQLTNEQTVIKRFKQFLDQL